MSLIPPLDDHLEKEKAAILMAALRHVPFDGWTERTLARAVEEAGLEPAMAGRAFPGGVRGLVDFFAADADARMAAELEKRGLAGMKVRERIATAVRVRLEQNAQHREAIRRAVALQLRAGAAPHTMRGLYDTVDAMWRAAGDDSTDYNFYTKRALLAGVYAATLFYWLDDQSDNFADTWEFLARRIDNIIGIQKLRGRAESLLDRLPSFSDLRPRGPFARATRRRVGRP